MGAAWAAPIALALATAGASVAVTARTAAQLAETVDLIGQAGERALALPADAADADAAGHVVRGTEERLGPVDLLVNNAGTAGPIGQTWELDPADWWRTLEVNLRGPLRVLHQHRGRRARDARAY